MVWLRLPLLLQNLLATCCVYFLLRLLPVRVLRRASRHLLLDGHYMAILHFGQLTIELTQWSWLGFFHQISVVLLGAALGVERHLQRAIAGADLTRLWSGKKID